MIREVRRRSTQDKVQVDFDRGTDFSTLEVNIELPARLPRSQLV